MLHMVEIKKDNTLGLTYLKKNNSTYRNFSLNIGNASIEENNALEITEWHNLIRKYDVDTMTKKNNGQKDYSGNFNFLYEKPPGAIMRCLLKELTWVRKKLA